MQVVCEPNGDWYILNDDGERLMGPFSNEDDAWNYADQMEE